jgi:hypothetical protein
MPIQPIETITWIEDSTTTVNTLINWITKPAGKLSDLKARARLYNTSERE